MKYSRAHGCFPMPFPKPVWILPCTPHGHSHRPLAEGRSPSGPNFGAMGDGLAETRWRPQGTPNYQNALCANYLSRELLFCLGIDMGHIHHHN